MRMIGMANGRRLCRSTESVGPRHDPYSRTTVQLMQDGRPAWTLVSCALAGDWLERDGRKVAECRINEPGADYWAKVVLATGASPQFWLDEAWSLVEAARWRRMTPEQRYAEEMAQRYDDALLSYARG